MHKVHSRTTQLRSKCRYPTYQSSPTIATRYATIATTKHHPSCGGDLDVFYPSVLSTAAGFKTEWKDIKRRDLYASVTEAIQYLRTIENDHADRLHTLERDVGGVSSNSLRERKYVQVVLDPFHASVLGLRMHVVVSKILKNPWSRLGMQCIAPVQGLLCFPLPDQQGTVGAEIEFEVQGMKQMGMTFETIETSTASPQINSATSPEIDSPPSTLKLSHGSIEDLASKIASPTVKLGNPAIELPPNSTGPTEIAKSASDDFSSKHDLPRWTSRFKLDRLAKPLDIRTATRSPAETRSSSSTARKTSLGDCLETRSHKGIPTVPVEFRKHNKKYLSYQESSFTYETPDFFHWGPDLQAVSLEYFQDQEKLAQESVISLKERWSTREVLHPYRDSRILTESDVKILSASIARLIYRMLSTATEASTNGIITMERPNGATRVLDRYHREGLQKNITMMEERISALEFGMAITDNLPFPRYTWKPDEALNEALNIKLLDAFATPYADISTLVPKVCYLLGASRNPPSIRTFDVLLSGFCSLQYYSIAAAVIDSVCECELYPTEITTAAILKYFTETNDFQGFENYTRQMGRNEMYHSLDQRPIQQPLPCNRATYAALINGWLSFGQEKQALIEYQTMLRSGLTDKTGILLLILRYAIETENWRLGTAVWQSCKKLSLEKKTFYWMLQLCATCKQYMAFADVLREASSLWAIFRNIGLDDFSLNEQDTKNLMCDARLLEKFRPVIRAPIYLHDLAGLRREARILGLKPTLQNWTWQRLSMVGPERRRRAEEAQPISTLLSRPV